MSSPIRDSSPRQQRPYAQRFRTLDPQQRAFELAELKKLYENHKLSVRQIAERKESSYGFMHARLTEAGVNLAANSTSYVASAEQAEP